jgi:hypothetical protein
MHKQIHVLMKLAVAAALYNAFTPQDDDERECDFTGCFDFEEEIDSEDMPPEEPPEEPAIIFTISGSGSGSFTCQGGPQESAVIEITAQGSEDGTVTGTVSLGVLSIGAFFNLPVSGGTTDGNTFSLSGVTSTGAVCGAIQPFTVSGDCGTDVMISYEQPDLTSSFTGNVGCTLL